MDLILMLVGGGGLAGALWLWIGEGSPSAAAFVAVVSVIVGIVGLVINHRRHQARW